MKVAVEPIEGCKRRLSVEAPAEDVQRAWERAYGRVRQRARLPGFRRGHVPLSLLKVHFAGDVRREVAEHLIPDVYRQALTEARLDPVAEPDLQDVHLEEGAPLTFVAVVEVRPEIALAEYKGLELEHAPAAVTSTEVDEAIERLRDGQAQFEGRERAAGPGDLVIVDYTLTIEGQAPVSQTGASFVVGDGSVIPEIDEAVAGMRPGEHREVGFRVPDDHRREELRGKAGTAAVKVVEVKEKILPEVNDELARSLGEFDTLDALRAEVRTQLEARREAEERRALEDKALDALLARHTFAVPEALVMHQIAHQVEQARERMRRQGVDPDAIQWDYAKVIAELRPGAERAVRRALLLDAIADREGIAPTAEAIEAEVERIARASQRPAPAIRRMMEKSGDLEALRLRLRERQCLDLVIAAAKLHA